MRAVHLFVMDTEAQPTPWGLEPLIDVGELATYLGMNRPGVVGGRC